MVVATSSSTQRAPAFCRSVRSDGYEVIVFPFTAHASMRIQPPWQMTPTGTERFGRR